jgi:hypothetical protein
VYIEDPITFLYFTAFDGDQDFPGIMASYKQETAENRTLRRREAMSHMSLSPSSGERESLGPGMNHVCNEPVSHRWQNGDILAHRINTNGQAEYLVSRWEETSNLHSETITSYWNRYYHANKQADDFAHV